MEVQPVLGFIENFTRFLAHGLKNRLQPAFAAVAMLEEEGAASNPEKLEKLVGLTDRSLQAAIEVLTSLEEFSRIEPGTPVPTEIQPWLQSLGAKHQIVLDLEGDPLSVLLDRSLWETIVSELLLNVKQHGGSRAAIHWSYEASGAADKSGKLKIRIEDFGPGLGIMEPEKALEATRKNNASTGTGLGLSKASWAAVLLEGGLELSVADHRGVIAEATGRTA